MKGKSMGNKKKLTEYLDDLEKRINDARHDLGNAAQVVLHLKLICEKEIKAESDKKE